jgi:hypothetical protein
MNASFYAALCCALLTAERSKKSHQTLSGALAGSTEQRVSIWERRKQVRATHAASQFQSLPGAAA